jgi:hypothetical protein
MKTFFTVIPTSKVSQYLKQNTVQNTAFNVPANYFEDEQEAIRHAVDKARLHRQPYMIMKSYVFIEPVVSDIEVKQTKM